MTYQDRRVEGRPVGAEETLGLAAAARELFVKVGDEAHHVGPDDPRPGPARLRAWLVHEDGLMRVPVLLAGDRLVRGFTPALYERALGPGPGPGGAP
jgi:hypothetical protein